MALPTYSLAYIGPLASLYIILCAHSSYAEIITIMCFAPANYRHTCVDCNYLNSITNHLCTVGSNGLLTSKMKITHYLQHDSLL